MMETCLVSKYLYYNLIDCHLRLLQEGQVPQNSCRCTTDDATSQNVD